MFTEKNIEIPLTYSSMRIMIPHNTVTDYSAIWHDCRWYMIYPHVDGMGIEHVHILLPANHRHESERYRKRAKDLGIVCNKQLSVKFCKDGLETCMQHMAKKATGNVVISEPPPNNSKPSAATQTETPKKRKYDEYEEDMTITISNHLKRAHEYRKRHCLVGIDLPTCVARMCNDGYYIDDEFQRTGAPSWHIDVFKETPMESDDVVYQAHHLKGLWRARYD